MTTNILIHTDFDRVEVVSLRLNDNEYFNTYRFQWTRGCFVVSDDNESDANESTQGCFFVTDDNKYFNTYRFR